MGRGLFLIFVIFGVATAQAQGRENAELQKPIRFRFEALTSSDQAKIRLAESKNTPIPKDVYQRIVALDTLSRSIKMPKAAAGAPHGIEPSKAVPAGYQSRHEGFEQGIAKEMFDSHKKDIDSFRYLNHYYEINPDGFVKAVIITNDHGIHGLEFVHDFAQ